MPQTVKVVAQYGYKTTDHTVLADVVRIDDETGALFLYLDGETAGAWAPGAWLSVVTDS